MRIYRVEAEVSDGGVLVLRGLPFQAGEKVEVIVRRSRYNRKQPGRYPLRGKPVQYIEPFESVAESDWEALQ